MSQTPPGPRDDETRSETQPTHLASSVEHMEEEIRHLEGLDRPRWGLWIGGFLLIAVVAVAYVALFREAPTRRAPTGTAGVLIEISEPRPGARDAPPTRFAWESVSGRHDYFFTLRREGPGDPLVQRSVRTAALVLTPEEAGLVTPGHTYLWRVEARRRDGTVLGSGESRFELR